MRRDRRYRYGPPIARPWRSFRSAFWLIGLAILFFWGHWWPGILILIGLSIILEGVFRGSAPNWNQNPPPPPSIDPMPAPMPMTPAAAAPVTDSIHRTDLLPGTCPHCGAPIRASEVKWTGAQSASCGYCSSNLPMKKQ
ncbi:MAG TPA: hypothetical protein VIN60_03140 [Anaerolineales bacterium]